MGLRDSDLCEKLETEIENRCDILLLCEKLRIAKKDTKTSRVV